MLIALLFLVSHCFFSLPTFPRIVCTCQQSFSPSSVAFPSFSLPSFPLPSFPFYLFLFLSFSLLLYICSGSFLPYTCIPFRLPLNCGAQYPHLTLQTFISSVTLLFLYYFPCSFFSWFIVFFSSQFFSQCHSSYRPWAVGHIIILFRGTRLGNTWFMVYLKDI